MEINKNLSQVSWPPERDFNQGRPEYEVGVLTTRPRRSVSGRGGERKYLSLLGTEPRMSGP
jgi:hypothetical protein